MVRGSCYVNVFNLFHYWLCEIAAFAAAIMTPAVNANAAEDFAPLCVAAVVVAMEAAVWRCHAASSPRVAAALLPVFGRPILRASGSKCQKATHLLFLQFVFQKSMIIIHFEFLVAPIFGFQYLGIGKRGFSIDTLRQPSALPARASFRTAEHRVFSAVFARKSGQLLRNLQRLGWAPAALQSAM